MHLDLRYVSHASSFGSCSDRHVGRTSHHSVVRFVVAVLVVDLSAPRLGLPLSRPRGKRTLDTRSPQQGRASYSMQVRLGCQVAPTPISGLTTTTTTTTNTLSRSLSLRQEPRRPRLALQVRSASLRLSPGCVEPQVLSNRQDRGHRVRATLASPIASYQCRSPTSCRRSSNELNPSFTTPIVIDYYFEMPQLLRFVVVDIDKPGAPLTEQDLIGQIISSSIAIAHVTLV